jgi:hypothetical protein
VAQQHANLTMDRRQLQRISATFVTELEGLNCLPGQRIAIQSKTMRWGQGVWVVSVAGQVVTVSETLTWQAGATHVAQLRDPQGKPHDVAGVTPGPTPNSLVLPGAPPFALVPSYADMEATHIAFGVQGVEVTAWTVARMRPQGSQVAVEANNYAPALWGRAMPHQRSA